MGSIISNFCLKCNLAIVYSKFGSNVAAEMYPKLRVVRISIFLWHLLLFKGRRCCARKSVVRRESVADINATKSVALIVIIIVMSYVEKSYLVEPTDARKSVIQGFVHHVGEQVSV